MKNGLPISLFLVLFFSDFLTTHLLPGVFKWTLEGVIAVVTIVLIAKIIQKRSFRIPLKYLLLFIFFLYIVITGIVINDISSLTIISGIRIYFKYVPLFLLPLVFDYTLEDLKKQFYILLSLGLIQLPVVIWQRFVYYKNELSGDVISGTVSLSSSLTFILIALILVLSGFYIKKKVRLLVFSLLVLILFIPVTLNETKVTILLLPIGFVSLLFAMRQYLSIRQISTILVSGVVLLIGFSFAYDKLYSRVGDAALMDSRSTQYVFKGYEADPNVVFDKKSNVVGEYKDLPTNSEIQEFGRLDSFLIPLDILWKKDFVRLLFGFGISNLTSELGDGATYSHLLQIGGSYTTLSLMIWETGILGTLMFVLFIVFIIFDAYAVSRRNDGFDVYASSWFALSIIILASFGYNTIFHINEIICLFMFFSGIIVFKRYGISDKSSPAY